MLSEIVKFTQNLSLEFSFTPFPFNGLEVCVDIIFNITGSAKCFREFLFNIFVR
jgi:hypothetical protein